MIRRDVIIAVIATFCLTSTLFMITTSNSQVGEYNPWADYNEDGVIDIFDIVPGAVSFGAEGDSTRNVNVTNWPSVINMSTYPSTGMNISLGPVTIPPQTTWNFPPIFVDGYKTYYIYGLFSGPYGLFYATTILEFKTGGLKFEDRRWSTLVSGGGIFDGYFAIKGPEMYIRVIGMNEGTITAEFALYVLP
jgi:hypothetical protein